METTTYMEFPYPSENADPFWDNYVSQMNELDKAAFMAKLQSNMFIGGGGTISFNAGSGLLTWTGDFAVPIFHYGKKITVKFGPDNVNRSAVIPEGAALVVEVPFSPTAANTLQYFRVLSQLDPANHQQMVVAWRFDNKVYFRGMSPVG